MNKLKELCNEGTLLDDVEVEEWASATCTFGHLPDHDATTPTHRKRTLGTRVLRDAQPEVSVPVGFTRKVKR